MHNVVEPEINVNVWACGICVCGCVCVKHQWLVHQKYHYCCSGMYPKQALYVFHQRKIDHLDRLWWYQYKLHDDPVY